MSKKDKNEKVLEKKEKEEKKTVEELLIDENEELKKENVELVEKSLRAIAELENYKKRTEKENEQRIKFSNYFLIEKLLPTLDQLNLVVNQEVSSQELKNYLIGFQMINKQIFQVLEEEGLKKIETKDQMFDPKFHEAIEKTNDKTKDSGIILATTQTGYTYKDRLLRPALVIVNEWRDENGNDK